MTMPMHHAKGHSWTDNNVGLDQRMTRHGNLCKCGPVQVAETDLASCLAEVASDIPCCGECN